MSCSKCEYAPKTYEEYCMSKKQPQSFCPDAYTEKAQYCGNYEKSQGRKRGMICRRSSTIMPQRNG